ncbi:hypothetical protein Belba_0274 [Belliella baltica DSM 15883]|uniref:Uncharacterized protein n=1 Tax=Belliella baltica (strain DSM 15883 / CIP 108006 / LMG 21964 / BA134) TaxID=866536 RepID=I3Z122_BELBD|nr:hypothetical protein [Belliella baltica]AFL82940.1 hypothetical protein Belba_0274 [Belliella baltica DSM 15883]
MNQDAFDDNQSNLADLKPAVKEKALEIAGKLLTEKSISKEDALKEGIKQAEEWFFDLEG